MICRWTVGGKEMITAPIRPDVFRALGNNDNWMYKSVYEAGLHNLRFTASDWKESKGNRPSNIRAAGHELATHLYEFYSQPVGEAIGRPVAMGVFGTDMQIELCNDGLITIIIDSKLRENLL